uniref:Uncharacterized protein n=1 Tax=Anguilla anguilla TaxID=7936 RepID=A0A0E9WR64_ANGAN
MMVSSSIICSSHHHSTKRDRKDFGAVFSGSIWYPKKTEVKMWKALLCSVFAMIFYFQAFIKRAFSLLRSEFDPRNQCT